MKAYGLAFSLHFLVQETLAFAGLQPTTLSVRSPPTQHSSYQQHQHTRPLSSSLASSLNKDSTKEWQAHLDELLSPLTPPGRRQILFQELLNANQEIRASVQKALADRDIDPLLTPTQKKLQIGTRAVARQLANDILPSLTRPKTPLDPLSLLPSPEDIQKIGSSVLTALQNQFQHNLETLQSDLADPSRIPQRISQQTEGLVKEAQNVIRETPVGLLEPPYTVRRITDDYEIREYGSYQVACTNMVKDVDTDDSSDSLALDKVGQAGAAFNSLAAYLFGANAQGRAMDMTTPVTTTFSGEMRFYLAEPAERIPEPLSRDEADSDKSNTSRLLNMYETGRVWIQEIPPARLAVRRFTGFVTEGEIARQKESLLLALEMDGVELDVAHGQAVGHLIFQYNPPYTIPVIRRNEIAVPVLLETALTQDLDEAWQVETED